MDLVPCHTSIEHPWFREHPDWYIWADRPNNWAGGVRRARRGAALGGRYYLHSFYPEQPDLDWRNPEVVAAMQDVLRFWLERGADGYRIDAIDRLLKDPELRDDPPAARAVRPAAARGGGEARARRNSRNAPDTGEALAKIREAAGDALPGRRGVPAERALAAVPRALRRRVRVRAAARALGRRPLRAAIEATTRRPGGGLGDVEPRLRPARHALRRARTPAPRRCCC